MLDLLLPQRCVVCGAHGRQLCVRCIGLLPRLRPPLCRRCGAPTAWPVVRCRECAGRRLAFASARAALAYDDAVRALVAGWKEHGLRRLAALAAEIVCDVVERPEVEALVPVPPDRDRTLKRGHHPASALARELGARWRLPVLPLLGRTRPVGPQRGLDRRARRRNVAGSFAATAAPRRVLVVDDVYTTGATAAAATSALRRAGARRVEVVTFARTVRAK